MAGKKKGNKPGIRRVGRTLAFQVLYSTHFLDSTDPAEMEDLFSGNPLVEEQQSETARDFAHALCVGYDANCKVVDQAIQDHSQHWKIARIAMVELSVLRLAIYEMLFTDIPVSAAINEAIELTKTFGDDKSRGFVNGILDGVAKSKKD
ncbi:MAG: transcription antitermination factor NusB [Pseudodesulfovibrio sp.]